jgi:Protein of unknown function (DUF3575)
MPLYFHSKNYIIKKYVLFILLNVLTITMNSQETKAKLPSNELRFNMLYAVSGLPEIAYEKIINDESSVGITLAVSVDSYIDLRYIILPNYRHYFSNKRAAGFFIEANSAFYMARATKYGYLDDGSYFGVAIGNKAGFGLGMAIGSKFISKRNWTANFTLGFGRDLINANFINESYPRLEISVGKRF